LVHLVLAVLVTAASIGRPPAAGPAGAAPGAAPAAVDGVRPVAPPRGDTIVWWNLAGPRPLDPEGRGGPFEPRPPGIRLGFRDIALPWALASPGQRFPSPGGDFSEGWALRAQERLERRVAPEARVRRLLLDRVAAIGRGAPVAFLPPRGEAVDDASEVESLRAFLGSSTELGMRVRGRAELGGDWSRYRPCLDAFQEACNPRLFPRLSPNLLFSVQLGGIISERLRVDVDFDQIDPFEAANTINIVYEGAPGEAVQRLEVGDVTFSIPSSRFLTEGIPSENFGFNATGTLGPLDVRAVWAEQKGLPFTRVFRLSGTGVERGFVQSDTLALDDADYVKGQFFFLVDPSAIVGYPHIDVLSLDGSEASPFVAPGPEPIQLYRYEAEPMLRQQVEGLIQADAVAERDGEHVTESGWFRYLQPGIDYFVHPSGLWVALRVPLGRDQMLAVTYVTATGDRVGDYNPEQLYNAALRPELRLLKASSANHQPGRPTWEMEMHQVYRVSGSPDVEAASVGVTISLGDPSAGRTFKRAASGEEITFLRLFGLDEEAPLDEIDPAFVYQPARDLFQDRGPGVSGSFASDQMPVQGTFLVFPTLRPFLAPPPLRAAGLGEEDTRAILGADANRRIYEDTDPFERDNGGRFLLTIPFQVRSRGVISSFSLEAPGIRDGSERIYVDERLLTRFQDYEIDYELGQVTLLDPEALFAANPDAPVRATFQQRQSFQPVPTSVMGLSARSRLGESGEINFLALVQNERTLAVRPTLGLEPAAIGLGGLNGRFANDVAWLDRMLDGIGWLRTSRPSSFVMDGELVMSLPTPNTQGDVFLDDFDAPADRPLSLLATDWKRGSAPAASDGAEAVLPPAVDETTYGGAVWQHSWIVESPLGDSLGIREGFLPRQEIDRQIRIAGSEVREPGMRVALGGATARSPRWASITTTLSPTGTDLTKSEFLEFYVGGGNELVLVIDLGEVSEDALFVNLDGLTSGLKDNRVPWGLGVLDHEADPSRGEIWGDEADLRGVWAEACLAERGRIYRAGDPRANCTRGNGRQDSEDLNGNGILDLREKHLRWVVRLDGSSPYLVRTRGETGTSFQLYRVPLQGLRDAEVGGAFTESDMRAVKNVRLTVAGERPQALTLARMRIVGSRWIRRGEEGVLVGMVGDTAAFFGRVESAPVSRVTEGDAYASPPGVLERLADPTAAFGGQGIEFSEKSLAVRFEDVHPGDRAEVYNRFPQRPRPFLGYREARMWVTARSGAWGEGVPHYFFFKVGTDSENFYLYRTRLRPPADAARAQPGDWLPEVVVDFDRWMALRHQAELELNQHLRVAGDPPVIVWSPDSTYAVVLGDRGRGPDLANVREMSFGVWNGGQAPITGELWVDELRLSRGATDPGVAGHLNFGVAAGDVLSARLTVLNRGAYFRQLRDTPSYETDRLVSFNSTLWLDRMTPEAWGVELPLTVALDRAVQDPVFLANSDVRADRLPGLRGTGARRTRVSLGFSKRTPVSNPLLDALLGGLTANVGWFDASDGSITTRAESQGVDARLGYTRRLAERSFPVLPGFLRPAVRALLPRFLEDPLADATLRWSPERVSFGGVYLRHESSVFRFDRIIETGLDSLVVPTEAPRESMETSAQIGFRPFGPLAADLTLLTIRDLLDPDDAASSPEVRELIRLERRQLGGMDWGWETQRVVRTGATFRPRLLSWLRHDFDWTTSFAADRHPSYLGRLAWGADSTTVLLRNANGDRTLGAQFSVDPAELSRGWLGEPGGAAQPVWTRSLRGLLSWVRPLGFAWRDGLASRFNRAPVDPGTAYQLGFGGADAFRFMDADTASIVTDRTSSRWTGGLALPLGVAIDLTRSTVDATVLDVRTDRSMRDEIWPNVQVRMDSVPVPGPARRVLERISLSGGYLESLRVVDLGGRSEQRRTLTDREVPLDVALTWLGGSVTSYRATFRAGEGLDPTGATRRDRETHRLAVTSALVPPFGLAAALDRPLHLTLIVSQVAESECRATVARLACVPFIDQVSRSAGLTLSALVRGFEVGIEGGATDRQSFVGQRPGSTQFQLGIFGAFQVDAGMLPARIGR
jgi:hypothetical protein